MRTSKEYQEALDKSKNKHKDYDYHYPEYLPNEIDILQELVDKAKLTETYELTTEDGEPLTPRGVVVCSCCDLYVNKNDKFCKHCGQALRSDE